MLALAHIRIAWSVLFNKACKGHSERIADLELIGCLLFAALLGLIIGFECERAG
jgi:hypothetical protein